MNDPANETAATRVNFRSRLWTASTNLARSIKKEHVDLFISASTLIVSAIGVLVVWFQLSELVREQRPWIGAPQITVEPPSRLPYYEVRLIFKNIGKTSTDGLFVRAKVVSGEWKDPMEKFCGPDQIKQYIPTTNFRAFSIPPESEFLFRGIVDPANLTFNDKSLKDQNIDYPHIIGCVYYRSTVDDQLHQTRFVAPLERGDQFKPQYIWVQDAN